MVTLVKLLLYLLSSWHLHALLHQLAGVILTSADQVGISCLICQKEKKRRKRRRAESHWWRQKHWCHCNSQRSVSAGTHYAYSHLQMGHKPTEQMFIRMALCVHSCMLAYTHITGWACGEIQYGKVSQWNLKDSKSKHTAQTLESNF